MPKSAPALIEPALLIWGRKVARLTVEDAAKKTHVKAEQLEAWERGKGHPTVKQLRALAHVYQQSFAAFYLPVPPLEEVAVPPDRRRLPSDQLEQLSPAAALDLRTAWEHREIVLELLRDQGQTPIAVEAVASTDENPESVGEKVRKVLRISYEVQKEWRDKRVAFNAWRDAAGEAGVLVFQATNVPVAELRGYSISVDPLPVVVVNRKDSYAGRSFTLLHEMTHILLRSGGLCDLEGEQAIEIFCNHAAGAALVPSGSLLKEQTVLAHGESPEWEDEEIEILAQTYSVSEEVLVRRLLTLRLTTKTFYEKKRRQYLDEFARLPKKKGFVSPAVDAVSALGKPYVRLVLDAFRSLKLTANDVADYLGVRLKHLDAVGHAVEGE
ncbi:MAG: hypothetical protein DMD38_10110 [Gemmatimonadetes bacterium]|nr:MAG: hypothetical protein AUG85_03320 [Gemmatimonadetes bacterium 13_1_20CM_4_66_11]PYP96056.1 MAG: hypothetical protein DMD38_10110 [Gemmatimonadota bacterium]